MKLNVILRVCDITSLCKNKVVDKVSCIKLCVPRLIESLENYNNYELTILNDNSSIETTTFLNSLVFKGTIFELSNRDDSNLTGLQKSRYSVAVQYNIAKTLPKNELIYFVEDDFLHYTDSIQKMVDNYIEFSSWDQNIHIGIFPEDFKQLHFHPSNVFNSTYIEPSVTVTGIDRYFKTVSYTHESYLISTNCLKEYFNDLYSITTIGFENTWEGDTFCTVWRKNNVRMLMPLGGFILHLDTEENMPNFVDWRKQIDK